MSTKPEIHTLVDNFITEFRAEHQVPVIILGGVEYPGVYKKDVFEHIRGVFAERGALALKGRGG
jgi:hypothetical protein